MPVDSSLCFSTIGMTASQDVRRRARRRARAAGDPARAVLRRARPRPAGDLDRARAGAAGGRRADPRARDDPRRRRAARARRVARAEAVAGQRRQRRPHPLLAVGGRAQPLLRRRRGGPPVARGARVPRRRARASARRCAGSTAPSFNSYHRIVPQYWAGAFTCWGHDNREAPVRVPSVFGGMEEASTNAELKAADASCNPYLALGGLIAAGLDGLERGARAARAGRRRSRRRSPRTSARSAGSSACPRRRPRRSTRSSADAVLIDALGPVLATSYLAVRRSEWAAYSAETRHSSSRVTS